MEIVHVTTNGVESLQRRLNQMGIAMKALEKLEARGVAGNDPDHLRRIRTSIIRAQEVEKELKRKLRGSKRGTLTKDSNL
jgi:hypothetical protein